MTGRTFTFGRVRRLGVGVLVALAFACGGEAADDASVDAIRPDTDDTSALDGLSGEQLRNRAEALTPEQARERGITDTLPGSDLP